MDGAAAFEPAAQVEAPLIHRAGAVPLPPEGEGFPGRTVSVLNELL